jgi:Uma2 family endonuclease
MVPTGTDYLTLIEAMPPGTVVTFSDVSWDEYGELLHELDGRLSYRLTYGEGRLEVMTVSAEHEGPAELLPHLILVLAEELDLNHLSRGSTTLRKKKKTKGTDPDDCFYFKEFKKISGKKRLDLAVDPPPDLALEVDITSGSRSKFPICAALGVPELWRHDGRRMIFYRLVADEYVETEHRELFPFLTPGVVLEFLEKGEAEGRVAMVKEFRKWVGAQVASA